MRSCYHGFVSGLPLTPSKKDSIWVIVDRLTKFAHFLPMCIDYSLQRLARLYISKIVRLHGVLVSIISDQDPRFTSHFWKKLHRDHGTTLNFSKAFHLQSDGQSERVIQNFKDMLRGYVIDFRVSIKEIKVQSDLSFDEEPIQILDRDFKVLRRKKIPLVKVLWRNHGSNLMRPLESQNIYYFNNILTFFHEVNFEDEIFIRRVELGEKKVLGPDQLQKTENTVKIFWDHLKVTSDRKKSYFDLKRKDIEFNVGECVFLNVSRWEKLLRFGR
ncbi:uncharacterized protein LOC105781443 [Gossypium raimondii]|uniref:uncharacterized protein LOC105781443 n=1 Tax=Gossypium raimondii TaxID=29730 RepID=UPI00063AF5CA|nr:uncharacterized protein LOC105781443 [Gossypium raimondii]